MAQANTGAPVSAVSVLRNMYAEGGIRGLFRGNLSNCLQVGPESALVRPGAIAAVCFHVAMALLHVVVQIHTYLNRFSDAK